ncbi:hypothetical protein NL676_037552 [Syzygium grande]|nr:hypothetical protein NL676_037552 [Syzygium grande]
MLPKPRSNLGRALDSLYQKPPVANALETKQMAGLLWSCIWQVFGVAYGRSSSSVSIPVYKLPRTTCSRLQREDEMATSSPGLLDVSRDRGHRAERVGKLEGPPVIVKGRKSLREKLWAQELIGAIVMAMVEHNNGDDFAGLDTKGSGGLNSTVRLLF